METIRKNILYIAWIQSLAATLGSLYFGEVAKIPPCNLCWYQRIAMYPLALIIPIGILKKDKNLHLYILPLSLTGLLIAFYQNLLYYHILPQNIAACGIGVDCSQKTIEWLGFITIPLLSLIAFGVVTICALIFAKNKRDTKK